MKVFYVSLQEPVQTPYGLISRSLTSKHYDMTYSGVEECIIIDNENWRASKDYIGPIRVNRAQVACYVTEEHTKKK